MTVYNVTEGSVLVRRIASSSSNIVNVIPTGGKIYVIGEEAGWLRTSSGYYVFKTDNITIDNPYKTAPAEPEVLLKATSLKANNILPAGQIEVVPGYTKVGSGGGTYSNPITPRTTTTSPTIEEIAAQEETPTQTADTATSTDEQTNQEAQSQSLAGKYVGGSANPQKIVAFNTDGTIATDSNGNYVEIDPPGDYADPSYSKNLRITSRTLTNNGKTYLIAKDLEKGGEVIIPTDKGRFQNPETNTYESYNQQSEEESQSASILDQILNIGSKIISSYTEMNELHVEDSRTIHGMPYQFMPIVDPRSSSGDPIGAFAKFGRKFQEKIVSRAPILYMQAGLPIFMRGYSDEAKKDMIDALWQKIEASEESEIQKLLDDSNMQYYSFEEQSQLYFKAVNSACTALAHLLQIESVQIPTIDTGTADPDSWGQTLSKFLNPKSLGNVNWSLRTQHQLGYYGGAVAFYINSESQIQESFINSSRQSELAGKINQISDRSMEAAFLMGGLAGGLDDKGFSGIASMMNFQNTMNRESMQGKEANGDGVSGLMGSLVDNVTNLIAGGKMVFPEIWSDSQFSRSYNVTIKLDSPETDTVSIFLNILVPLVHILGFVLPRSAGPNMYTSPFLVRAFYKSMFHIDMGIITSCQVTKGDQGAWNIDGLPCQITVELTIKDLYQSLSQALGYKNNTLISNPAQLEYLANLAGVNIAPANFMRTLELYMAIKGVRSLKEGLVGTGVQMMQNVFKKLQNLNQATKWKM